MSWGILLVVGLATLVRSATLGTQFTSQGGTTLPSGFTENSPRSSAQVNYSTSQISFEWKHGTVNVQPKVIDPVPAFLGSRYGAAMCGGDEKIWLFGGYAPDQIEDSDNNLNGDLWSYSPQTAKWTWYSGFLYSPVNYAQNGDLSPLPGGRFGALIWYYNNFIYLFGGQGKLGNDTGPMGDLWKFDIGARVWKWINGSSNTDSDKRPYFPNPLVDYAHTFSGADLYIYGGMMYYNGKSEVTSDVWLFSSASETWSFYNVSGLAPKLGAAVWLFAPNRYLFILGGASEYGQVAADLQMVQVSVFDRSKLVVQTVHALTYPASQNSSSCGGLHLCSPGARVGAVAWNVPNGASNRFYLFGGFTAVNSSITIPEFNDVWFADNGDIMDWFWMAGYNGTLPKNTTAYPPPLYAPSMHFNSTNELVWYFGGIDSTNGISKQMLVYSLQNYSWEKTGLDPSELPDAPVYPSFPYTSQLLPTPGSWNGGSLYIKNDTLILLGGQSYFSNSTLEQWSFNLISQQWTNIQNSSKSTIAAFGHAVCIVGDEIYVFGGTLPDNRLSSSLFKTTLLDTPDSFLNLGGGVETTPNRTGDNIWPSARSDCAAWVSGTDLWIFGGYGIDQQSDTGFLDDIWKYDTSVDIWQFISGSNSSNSLDSANRPGGRSAGTSATNGTHVWFFGGYGPELKGENASFVQPELWQYELSTDSWILLSTSSEWGSFPPTVGAGGPSSVYYPPSRTLSSSVYINGSFFIWGGYNKVNSGVEYIWGDLWEYDTTNDLWFWIHGPYSATPQPYPLGYNSSSYPVGRYNHAYAAVENGLWIYGGKAELGESLVDIEDLWFINIQHHLPEAPVPPTSTTGSSSTTGGNPTCGNGIIEIGEQCDTNGTDCCTSNCTFSPSGTTCRPAASACDITDTCSGSSEKCVNNVRPIGFVCNFTNGACTVPMVCDLDSSVCRPPKMLVNDSCGICGGDNTSCTNMGICGDGLCNPTIGEDCVSCSLDCGSCVMSSCKDGCEHGTCQNGYCACDSNYSGPACNTEILPTNAQITNDTQIQISVGTDIYFSIQIFNVTEYTPDNTLVDTFQVKTQNISESANSANESTFWNFTIAFPNGAAAALNFLTTGNDPLPVTFANTSRIVQPHSVKVTIEIVNWPFYALRNHLEIVLAIGADQSKQGICSYLNSSVDSSGTTRWIEIVVNDIPLYGSFLDYAVIDQITRPIQIKSVGSLFSIVIPHFWVSALIDPDFSVLIGTHIETTNPCSGKKHSSIYTAGVIVGIVLGILVGLIIVVGCIYFAYRKQKYRKEWREKIHNANIELQKQN
eukprot:Phypoly_transcript_00713.p1 GENE.Phypoly_transcript_00713~~Phypoly_transcript_00713.p1  ORF type:complete len:1308 (+),score=165.92 Phypoly_transcript_00713:175-4098(+)